MESITVEKPTLRMINSEEIRTISEWEKLYPETWLFIGVTREDLWEIYEGKLIATAADPAEFFELDQFYSERGMVNLTTRGVSTGPQPAVVTTFSVLPELPG
ncbi:MAG: hypothetical protein U0Z53_14515 [Blastocatellia bacterium]